MSGIVAVAKERAGRDRCGAERSRKRVARYVIDPVGTGYVQSLSRPGGNSSGFTLFEYKTAGKLLELLKEIAPNIVRVAILQNPNAPVVARQLAAIQELAPSLGIALNPIDASDDAGTERSR
jgi:putative ABC transport system substrate-binding protein